MTQLPSSKDILEASNRISLYAHRTPVLTSESLNRMIGALLYFKCENFQKVGAFKFRGACNAVFSLTDEEAKRGVATHSSGNHAQALALAARLRNIPAYIVMPSNAPRVKVNAVRGYGAEITFCEPTLQAREEMLNRVVDNTGAYFIHPYNDYRIITGQATATLELLEEFTDLDVLIAPVGGGGLLSGMALSAHYFGNNLKVIGAEPAGADDAFRSLKENRIIPSTNPTTIADGLLTSLGDKTFPIIKDYVDEIITVSERSIALAMRYLWERLKVVVEPSAAVPLAVLLESGKSFQGQRVGIILSGGNVDLKKLPNYLKLIEESGDEETCTSIEK